MDNMSEILLQSIQTLIDKSLEGLQFTTTEIATITDATEAAQGKYMVSNGSISYIAYSDNSMYREKDQVQINIPNNDFNQIRTIIGKVRSVVKEPVNYQKPSDKILVTSDIVTIEEEKYLVANDPQKIIENCGTNISIGRHGEKLVIKADFKTLLSSYAPKAGTYGLLITAVEQGTGQEYKYTFSSKSMIGDIYNFDGYFPQDFVIDISDISVIDHINVDLFQMQDFVDINNKNIPYQDAFGNQVPPNIFVDNIYVGLGYDVSDIQEDKLLLTSAIDDFIKIDDNKIKVDLAWAHVDGDGKINNITDPSVMDPCMLCWYVSEDTLDSADQYSGIFWKIANLDVIHPHNFTYGLKDGTWGFVDSENNMIDTSHYHNKIYELPYANKPQFKIKVILFLGNERYQSNTLVINNSKYQEETQEIEFKTQPELTLEITSPKNDNGYYLYYDAQGSIQEGEEKEISGIIRTITPYLNESLIDVEKYDIQWAYDSTFIEKKADDQDGLFKYTIKENIPSNGMNKSYIDCIITSKEVDSQNVYKATLELYFGTYANGTNIGFGVQLFKGIATNGTIVYKAVNAYTINDQAHYYIKPFLLSGGMMTMPEVEKLTISNWPNSNSQNYFKISTDDINEKGYYPLTSTIDFVPDDNQSIFYFKYVYDTPNYIECLLPIPIRSSEQYDINGTIYLNYGQGSSSPLKPLNNTFIDGYDNKTPIMFTNFNFENNDYWKLALKEQTTEGAKHQNIIDNIVENYNENKSMPVLNIKIDEQTVYSIPFIITKEKFGINLLNQWDGRISINEEEDYIMAATIGAGVKNKDNTFSGVMLGELKDLTIHDESSFINEPMTGLYGFDKGALTYAFREDGSAYIGGKGTIQSLNYREDFTGVPTSGTKIDLSNGSIKASELKIQDIMTIYPSDENNEGHIEINADKLNIVGNSGGIQTFDTYLRAAQNGNVWYWDTQGVDTYKNHMPTASIESYDIEPITIDNYYIFIPIQKMNEDGTTTGEWSPKEILPLPVTENSPYKNSDWWINEINQIYQLQNGVWILISDNKKIETIERELNSIGLTMDKTNGSFNIRAEQKLETFYSTDDKNNVILASNQMQVKGKDYKFDTEGLRISSDNSDITTLIDNTGMKVEVNGQDHLVANNEGVDAINLTAHKYLVVDNGKNSADYFGCRFTSYGEKRIGCFYLD